MIKKKKEKTVRDILNIFLPKIWVLVVVGAIFASVMGGYSMFIKKDTYTTTTDVVVSVDPNGTNTNNSQTNQFAQQVVKTYEKFIYGGDFLKTVCAMLSSEQELQKCFLGNMSEEDRELASNVLASELNAQEIMSEIERTYNGNGITPSALKRMISVKTDSGTPTFELKVTSGNKKIVWAVSQVICYQIETEDALDSYVKSNLDARIYTNPAESYSVIPANSKNTVRNSAIAFAIGFALAAAAVWVYSMFDIVIRDAAKIEENIDVPVLGVIPRHEINAEEGKKK